MVDFKLSGWIVTILLVGGVFVGLFGFFNYAAERHGITIDKNYAASYDQLESTFEGVNDTITEIKAITGDKEKNFFTGTWDMFRVAKVVVFGAGGATWDALSAGNSMIMTFLGDMGVAGTWIQYLLLALLAVGLLFAIIEIVTRVRA